MCFRHFLDFQFSNLAVLSLTWTYLVSPGNHKPVFHALSSVSLYLHALLPQPSRNTGPLRLDSLLTHLIWILTLTVLLCPTLLSTCEQASVWKIICSHYLPSPQPALLCFSDLNPRPTNYDSLPDSRSDSHLMFNALELLFSLCLKIVRNLILVFPSVSAFGSTFTHWP